MNGAKVKMYKLRDGRSANAVIKAWKSPSGHFAAEYDGQDIVPLTNEDGEYIAVELVNNMWREVV